MWARRLEEAIALSPRTGNEIKQRNKARSNRIAGKTDVKTLWAAVGELVGRIQEAVNLDGISADSPSILTLQLSRLIKKEYLTLPMKHTTSTPEFVCRSVVIARLLYASSAWWGFRIHVVVWPTVYTSRSSPCFLCWRKSWSINCKDSCYQAHKEQKATTVWSATNHNCLKKT